MADGILRLSLAGELDRWSAPLLEDRLGRLRALKTPVRLDLSQLEFIDSTGVRVLVQSVGDARIKRWQFQIERELAPQVASLFRLMHLDRFIEGDGPAVKDGPTLSI
ncbi:MAG TPA: STAS domain-containing protein [Solirubrobacteraceae bacterium]|nr:STAS domain-containing protein [Solirubrobacteraceae bacterium]